MEVPHPAPPREEDPFHINDHSLRPGMLAERADWASRQRQTSSWQSFHQEVKESTAEWYATDGTASLRAQHHVFWKLPGYTVNLHCIVLLDLLGPNSRGKALGTLPGSVADENIVADVPEAGVLSVRQSNSIGLRTPTIQQQLVQRPTYVIFRRS